MFERKQLPNFEQAVLPHLDAAYNLARWLMRNEQDAQDVAQEAYLRAFRFFPGFRGGDARAWLLKIVRNTCYTWLHANRPLQEATEFDENLFHPDSPKPIVRGGPLHAELFANGRVRPVSSDEQRRPKFLPRHS
jgi:RNA polymerase sigma factor (sigma-70 family)